MSISLQHIAALTLARTNGIGPVTYYSLLNIFPNPEDALLNLAELCRARGRKVLTPPPKDIIEQEIEATLNLGASFLFHDDVTYPPLLKETPDAPPVLTYLGDVTLLSQKQVAIVGTRNASLHGKNFTQELATTLAQHQIATTSGLARGIDTAAHQASLNANFSTIAAIAGGINHVYPPENAPLRQKIIEKGCLITESPLHEVPTAHHFPRRNRLIAGLSIATVVTEAARHSGSLITAQYAGEYGRDVFAVPGNPKDTRAAGPNHLLSQGAQILLSAEELIDALPQHMDSILTTTTSKTFYTREEQESLFDTTPQTPPQPLEQFRTQTPEHLIKEVLSTTPLNQDDLLRQLNIPSKDALALLSELELMGEIQRHSGNKWSL